MTTTRILGLNVTCDEYARYEQIRTEMLGQGRSPDAAELWAGNSIGIGHHIQKAHEYAALVAAGSAAAPIRLVLNG